MKKKPNYNRRKKASPKKSGTKTNGRIVGELATSEQPEVQEKGPETVVDSKNAKAISIREGAKKRNQRMLRSRKQREKIERERQKKFQSNTSALRQKRRRKQASEKKERSEIINKWTVYIAIAARIQSAFLIVQRYRQYQHNLCLQDFSSRVITRQMRLFRFRQYRKRIKGAMHMIGIVLLVKVRLWKQSRRRVGSDNVRAFLLELEKENQSSGGCLALIVKGKKWRAYRQKIIILQRLWRRRLSITEAQALLIDYQWKRAQDLKTKYEAEAIFKKEESVCLEENERIEAINRTRKLIKLRPLPMKKCRTLQEIKEEMTKGVDILSRGNIVPHEIRNALIRDTLRRLRQMYMKDVKSYDIAFKKYQEYLTSLQRRRALLVSFSGNKVANAWVWDTQKSNGFVKAGDDVQNESRVCMPSKPFFRAVLCPQAVQKLMDIGAKHVNDIRKAWRPENMDLMELCYDSRLVVEIQQREKGSEI